MFGLHETWAFWLTVAVNSIGLLALILTRLTARTNAQTLYQGLFLLGLATVGIAMLSTVALGSGYWISFAITTSIMIVGVSIDFGSSRRLRTASL